jgi:hypothetical protein
MARPKLTKEEKKGKLGISINKKLIIALDNITSNKSKFIEDLIINFFQK